MLFEHFRKRCWLNRIKALTDLTPAMENELLGFGPNRIAQLATIAKRYNSRNTKDRSVFKFLLKLFIGNPSMIDRAEKNIDAFKGLVDSAIQEQAKAITDKAKDYFSAHITKSCSLIESVACRTVTELLLCDINDDEVYSRLIQEIREDPSKYIKHYNDWLKSTAEALFSTAHNKLREGLPDKCPVNRSACTEELCRILNDTRYVDICANNVMHEEVIGELCRRINQEPDRFIVGLDEYLREMVDDIFNKFNNHVSANLPKGISLNKPTSTALIRNLIQQGCQPSQLAERFFGILRADPANYLLQDGKKPPMFTSSSGYSSGGTSSSPISSSKKRW